jgi:hypothetical protein
MITHADIKNFWQLPETERQKLRIAVEMQEPRSAANEEDYDEECPKCGEGINRNKNSWFYCKVCKIDWRECEECGDLHDPRTTSAPRRNLCQDCYRELSNKIH